MPKLRLFGWPAPASVFWAVMVSLAEPFPVTSLTYAQQPNSAESFTAERAWDLFARVCPAAVVAPEGVALLAKVMGHEAHSASTQDNVVTMGSIYYPELETADIHSVLINYGADRLPGGMHSHCMLHVYSEASESLPGLPDVVRANAKSVLGEDYETHGGELVGTKAIGGLSLLFSSPGFPPEKIVRLQLFDRAATLILARQSVEGEN